MSQYTEWFARIRLRTALLIGAAIVLLLAGIYGLAVAFGLPLLVRDALADWQAQVPGMQVTLERVSFNPWKLAVTARQFVVKDAGRTLIDIHEMRFGVSLSSLWRRAFIVNEVELEGASLYLRWDANGVPDIEQILPRRPRARADRKTRSSMAWEIDHLSVIALRVQVADPSVGLADPLDVTLPRLEVDHIGTLKGSESAFTVDLHGRYDGKPVWDLHWHGDVDFAPLSSAGRLQLTHISLPWLDRTLGHRWPVQVQSGQAELDAEYELGKVQGLQRLIVRNATIDVQQLDVSGRGPVAPKLSLRELRVQAAHIDTSQREVTGKSVLLDTPELVVHRLQDGQLDLLRLVQQWPVSPTSAPPADQEWSIRWPVADVRSAAVLFDDQSLEHLGHWTLPGVNLHIEDFDSRSDSALQITAGGQGLGAPSSSPAAKTTGRWSLKGSLRPRSGALHADWTLNDLDLRAFNVLPPIKGRVEIKTGQLTANGSVDGELHDIQHAVTSTTLRLRKIDVASSSWGELSAEELTLTGLAWDHLEQQISAHALLATEGSAMLQKDTRTVRFSWNKVELQNAVSDLAAARFTLGSATGNGLAWEGHQLWLQLPELTLQDVRADGQKRQLELGMATIHHGQARLSIRRDGAIAPLAELQSVLPTQSSLPAQSSSEDPPAATVAAEAPWNFVLHGAHIGLASLRFRQGGSPLPALTATRLGLRLGEWSSGGTEPLEEHLHATLEGGQLRWDGTFSPRSLTLEGHLDVQHVNLTSLQPLLAENTYAGIDHASISLSGELALHSQAVHYEGTLTADAAQILDTRNHHPLLSWSAVSVPEIRLDWPGALQISRIDLDGLRTSVTILPDHHINWAAILRPQTPAAAGSAVQTTAAQASAPGPLSIQLDQLSLTQGDIDFDDESLSTPFHAAIYGLTGNIGPLSTDTPEAWTQMILNGQVNDYGRVNMTGRIMPLSRPLRTQVNLHFRGIELPTLNPYAAEIAGYRIERGLLDLELQYTLEKGLIEGDNRARIDQLVLGPRVRKANGPDLPLRTIIDILRNDEGVIDLEVPVRGNLNDPNIVLRDIAFEAVEGVLRKTFESPFTLVANMFGGDTETLRHIGFAGGTADLTEHDRQKLNNIAQVLGKRPKLLMFIQPGYNSVADTPGGLPTTSSSPSGESQSTDASASRDTLRSLALRRAEGIKAVLVAAGIQPDRIYIDEPSSPPTLGKNGAVLTTLDLKVP